MVRENIRFHAVSTIFSITYYSLTHARGRCYFSIAVYTFVSTGAGDLVNDYESAERGGNRYATILLYMSDLTEHDGGETVFVEAWPGGLAEEDRIPMSSVCLENNKKDEGTRASLLYIAHRLLLPASVQCPCLASSN
jgi:hypothetical protein